MAYKERGNGQGSVTTLKDSKGKKKYQVRVTVGSKFDAERKELYILQNLLGYSRLRQRQRLCLQSIIRVLMTLLLRLLQ